MTFPPTFAYFNIYERRPPLLPARYINFVIFYTVESRDKLVYTERGIFVVYAAVDYGYPRNFIVRICKDAFCTVYARETADELGQIFSSLFIRAGRRKIIGYKREEEHGSRAEGDYFLYRFIVRSISTPSRTKDMSRYSR